MILPVHSPKRNSHKMFPSLPVVNDGIKGDGVFSVLCLGVAVVNGALIFMTVGRIKLCKRIFPVSRATT